MKHVVVIGALLVCNLWGEVAPSSTKTHLVMKGPYTPTAEIQESKLVTGGPLRAYREEEKPQTGGPLISIAPKQSWARALFAPNDDIQAALLEYIKKEKKRIQIAIFVCTDKTIAQALVDAKKRGVDVEIVIDSGCIKERAINILCNGGCSVYIYEAASHKGETAGLMHNKFIVFDNNNTEKLVWTGSYNFTNAARKSNQENVTIVQDEKVFQDYTNQFKKLKEGSQRYCQKK